ncbi:winged helix-turn-helix transcriptional regulator [Candidatus Nitrospira salsa]|nr:MAG: MarR family transcriptional regulator [Nitrospirales bacterium]
MPTKNVSCPVEVTLEVIAGRWKILIIHQLLEGTKRFNQLQRELGGITHRTLTKQLREMEERGLLKRKDYREIPPRVEYSLSPVGRSLKRVLLAMQEWGEYYGRIASRKN